MLPSPPLATVILDPPTALVFGAALGVISTRLIERAPDAEVLKTVKLAAGWSALYGVCVAYFFFAQPDWMFAYLKDAREVSLVPAFIVFLAILVAHGAAGAGATSYLISRGLRPWAWLVTLGALLTLGGAFWLQWRQYLLLGTYAEFHTGTALPLQSVEKMKMAMNVSGIVAGLSAVAIIIGRIRRPRAVLPK